MELSESLLILLTKEGQSWPGKHNMDDQPESREQQHATPFLDICVCQWTRETMIVG